MVVLASVFIFLGLVFLLIAAIGMVRLPDVYTRSHAVGLTDTWGAFFMLLGLALYQGFSLNAVKILVVLILLLFSRYCHFPCHCSCSTSLRAETLVKGARMIFSFEIFLLLLLVITAGAAILVKDLISAVLILGSYSFFLAIVWAWFGAVDVAFVESVVGAGLATVFFLLTLFVTAPKDTRIHPPSPPWTALIGLPLLGLLLLYAASDLPKFGDPASPASVHVSPVYLENSMEDTLTPNVVTSVLMDYRAFDTLIETVVIFTAGIACALLLRRNRT